MKIRTIEVREGEYLGPIDWSYDFRQHFRNYCCDEKRKDEMCARSIALLRQVQKGGKVSTGWGFREVYRVGMYDGWPFWKPTPYVLISGTLGPEWQPFCDIQEVQAPKSPCI